MYHSLDRNGITENRNSKLSYTLTFSRQGVSLYKIFTVVLLEDRMLSLLVKKKVEVAVTYWKDYLGFFSKNIFKYQNLHNLASIISLNYLTGYFHSELLTAYLSWYILFYAFQYNFPKLLWMRRGNLVSGRF